MFGHFCVLVDGMCLLSCVCARVCAFVFASFLVECVFWFARTGSLTFASASSHAQSSEVQCV